MEPVRNVVLIVADTFRRDRLGCYAGLPGVGAAQARTPHLDQLAASGAVFDHHYAGAFPTPPARTDHALGKWTFTFTGGERLPRDETPLSVILSQGGVRTAGVADTPFYVRDGAGFDRGYRHFVELPTQSILRGRQLVAPPRVSEYDYAAPHTFATAERVLERLHRERFFLLVDTWDPHEPWDPPDWYVRPYLPDYDGQPVAPAYNYYQRTGLTEAHLRTARACYAGECTMVDRWAGRLLDTLDALGLAEQTAVLFTTDHGFYFGEHGGMFGKAIQRRDIGPRVWGRSPFYEEICHIPLIARVPGLTPRRVPALTSAVDLMPTILDLMGVPVPAGTHLAGKSLLPALRGDPTGRDFTVTSYPLTGPQITYVADDCSASPGADLSRAARGYQPATISTPEWSLLYGARGEAVELYHLPSDPHQAQDVAAAHPGVVQDLHRAYVSLLEEAGTPAPLLEPRRTL